MGPGVLGCLPRVFYMTVGGLAEGSDSVAHCTPVALEHLAEGSVRWFCRRASSMAKSELSHSRHGYNQARLQAGVL